MGRRKMYRRSSTAPSSPLAGLYGPRESDVFGLTGRRRGEPLVVKRVTVALGERQHALLLDAVSRTAALGLSLTRAELLRLCVEALPDLVSNLETSHHATGGNGHKTRED